MSLLSIKESFFDRGFRDDGLESLSPPLAFGLSSFITPLRTDLDRSLAGLFCDLVHTNVDSVFRFELAPEITPPVFGSKAAAAARLAGQNRLFDGLKRSKCLSSSANMSHILKFDYCCFTTTVRKFISILSGQL